jgi:hypothetical protein
VNSARESESCNSSKLCGCEVAYPIGRLLVDDECGSAGLTLQIERSMQRPQRLTFSETCVAIIPLSARQRGGPLRHLCGSATYRVGRQRHLLGVSRTKRTKRACHVFRPRKRWRARFCTLCTKFARGIPERPIKFVFPLQSMIFRTKQTNDFSILNDPIWNLLLVAWL